MMFTRYMRGMVYWCDLPRYEKNPHLQAGKRPVIIVSNNIANCMSNNVTVVPCTTNTNKNLNQPTHIVLPINKDMPSVVLCEDIVTIHKDLLGSFMGMLDDDTMKSINKCLAAAIGLCEVPNIFKPTETINNTEIQKEEPARQIHRRGVRCSRSKRNERVFRVLQIEWCR